MPPIILLLYEIANSNNMKEVRRFVQALNLNYIDLYCGKGNKHN
jgi:hypothetical protein